MLAKMWRNRNPFSLFAEMYNGTATMESNMEGAKNLFQFILVLLKILFQHSIILIILKFSLPQSQSNYIFLRLIPIYVDFIS